MAAPDISLSQDPRAFIQLARDYYTPERLKDMAETIQKTLAGRGGDFCSVEDLEMHLNRCLQPFLMGAGGTILVLYDNGLRATIVEFVLKKSRHGQVINLSTEVPTPYQGEGANQKFAEAFVAIIPDWINEKENLIK